MDNESTKLLRRSNTTWNVVTGQLFPDSLLCYVKTWTASHAFVKILPNRSIQKHFQESHPELMIELIIVYSEKELWVIFMPPEYGPILTSVDRIADLSNS